MERQNAVITCPVCGAKFDSGAISARLMTRPCPSCSVESVYAMVGLPQIPAEGETLCPICRIRVAEDGSRYCGFCEKRLDDARREAIDRRREREDEPEQWGEDEDQ